MSPARSRMDWWAMLFLVLLVLLPLRGDVCQAVQAPPAIVHAQPGPAISSRPVGPSAAEREAWDSIYQRLLERTNEQLSLWTNPYGVLVGALGVLVALMAIFGAVIIYRQGSEYRRLHTVAIEENRALIQGSIQEYQGVLKAFIDEKNREFALVRDKMNADIARAKEELKTAEGKTKDRLEARLAELEREKKTLERQDDSPLVKALTDYADSWMPFVAGSVPVKSAASPFASMSMRDFKCPHCGQQFSARPPMPSLLLRKSLHCPYCGKDVSVSL